MSIIAEADFWRSPTAKSARSLLFVAKANHVARSQAPGCGYLVVLFVVGVRFAPRAHAVQTVPVAEVESG